jgi:hypothetical protein
MDEELLEQLRIDAEEYSEVTDAIKADMPNINDDILAVYYDATKRNDEVLRLMMEEKFGADKIGRLDNYFNKMKPEQETSGISVRSLADPLADKGSRPNDDWDFEKDQGMFGKVGNVAQAVGSDVATFATSGDIVDAPAAGIAGFFKNFQENSAGAARWLGDKMPEIGTKYISLPKDQAALDFLTDRGVDVTDIRENAGGHNGQFLKMPKGFDEEEYNTFKNGGVNPLDEELAGLQSAEDRALAKIDSTTGNMVAALTEWGTAFALTPGGNVKVAGRVGVIGIGMLRGAAADKLVMDAGDQNLAALAEELGVPGDALWDIIATDADDAQWKNELRIIAEGAVLGGVTDTLIDIVGAARKMHRGADPVEVLEEAEKSIIGKLKEATEARQFTADEINNAQKTFKETGEAIAEEAPTSAEVILGEANRKLSAVKLDADKAFDTFMQMDATKFTDEAIESATGIRKFSEWTEWDNIADVRKTISEHVDGVFEEANKRQSIDSMVRKAEAIRKAQMKKSDNPDWADAVITKREDAVQYINNVIVETTLAKQLDAIRVWADHGLKNTEYLPPFLSHLKGPNVSQELREKAISGYVEGLVSAAGVIGKKNETQISEAARVMSAQRWIKYGKIKDAEQQLESWIAKQKAEGNVEWQDVGFGLNRLTQHGEVTPTLLRQIVKHVGEGTSVLVRFRNANLLANTKTIGINMISEAFGQTQAGSITRVWEGIKSLAKGKPVDGIERIRLGVTFGFRQFAEIGKATDNALRLMSDGIGEVSGAASAFDTAGKGIGMSFREIGKDAGALGTLAQYTAGVNRFIGAISEAFSSMAVYTKTRDDAILGQFGKKWQDIAKKRTLTQQEVTQMFVENDMPSLLLRRTKSGNLIDAGSAENAAIIGFRESGELAGFSDDKIREFRKLMHKTAMGGAIFDFLAPFAQTIMKITKRSLMNGVPAPLWFISTSFRKRITSKNPAIRNLAEAEFALNSTVYTGLVARGFFEAEDADEARAERISKLKPGESIVAFEPIDEAVGFKEDKQGWVRITMQENGELKETYVLPQELNVVFSTAIAAQSVGRYFRHAYNDDPSKKQDLAHFMMMAAVGAPTASIRSNNLVNSFVESVERTAGMFKDVPSLQNWFVQNAANFVPLAPGTRHLSEDFTKLIGDGETMQYNRELADDRGYKMTHNFGWYGAAYRQLTRTQDYEYLNVRRGPFGSPLPTAGRGLALIAKSAEIGQGEKLFAEFMEHNAGVDADRLSAAVTENGLDLKEVRTAHNEHSLGDQMLENLRNVTISQMNIDERMLYEFTNPKSKFNALQRELEMATNYSSKRDLNNERTAPFLITEQVRYLSNIRREYLEVSKHELLSKLSTEKRRDIEERIAQYKSDYELIKIHAERLRGLYEEEGQ